MKGLELPSDISFEELTETFNKYTENDYYEWLKDNFNSFFNHYNPDWDWIRKTIKRCRKESLS